MDIIIFVNMFVQLFRSPNNITKTYSLTPLHMFVRVRAKLQNVCNDNETLINFLNITHVHST